MDDLQSFQVHGGEGEGAKDGGDDGTTEKFCGQNGDTGRENSEEKLDEDETRVVCEELLRRKASGPGDTPQPSPSERFEARLRRKAELAHRELPSTDDCLGRCGEEVARERFEDRPRHEALAGRDELPARSAKLAQSTGDSPVRSSEEVARERFEARLRRKASNEGGEPPLQRQTPTPTISDVQEVSSDRDGAVAPIGVSLPDYLRGDDASGCGGGAPRTKPLLDSGALLARLREAQRDLEHVEVEHGRGGVVSVSHPRVAGILAAMASSLSLNAHTAVPSGETSSDERHESSPPLEHDSGETGLPNEDPTYDVGRAGDGTGLGGELHASSLRASAAALNEGETRVTCPNRRSIISGSTPCGDFDSTSCTAMLEADVVRQNESGFPLDNDRTPQQNATQPTHVKWRDMFNMSILRHSHAAGSVYAVRATLVEEEEIGEVYEAQPMGFWHRRGKKVAWLAVLLSLTLTVFLSLTLTGVIGGLDVETEGGARPSAAPTFDPRPTLEVVQNRGHVLCGLESNMIEIEDSFYMNLCRAVAAVVIGHSKAYEPVPVTAIDRFEQLRDRSIDLLLHGDTHTLSREVSERTTGTGFTFSNPYAYDHTVFVGNSTFVKCAEEQKRYDECSSLMICVSKFDTHHEFVKTIYPASFLRFGPSTPEVSNMLLNGTCNVVAEEKFRIIYEGAFRDAVEDKQYVVGTKLLAKRPLAMVTRKGDRVWSDIVSWVYQALIYGEEQGLTKDPKLCHNDTDLTSSSAIDLDFMNAVYCVGNYGEIFGSSQINNGTGMLYATPFGDLDLDRTRYSPSDSILQVIMDEETFKCGVVVPDGFRGDILESDKLVGMSVEFCRVLAAALFSGDMEQVDFVILPETGSSPYASLANGTVDVLVGGQIQRKYDFEFYPPFDGLDFSNPYYYGNEPANTDVSFYSIATREDDGLFSSFVNMIVVATIYAEERGISRENYLDMPLVNLFGPRLYWALRDAIAYGGNYDDIYCKHFGGADWGDSDNKEEYEIARGRNALNEGGPMMLSFPHLP
ncbi:hypothetical protein ACHAWF_005611 [Thalassiosira exigua]